MVDSEEKRMMQIVCEDGSLEEVEVVLDFEFKDNKKEYVIYTKDERDEENNITLYISNVDRNKKGFPSLLGIHDEFEWERIQEVIKELTKSRDDINVDDCLEE